MLKFLQKTKNWSSLIRGILKIMISIKCNIYQFQRIVSSNQLILESGESQKMNKSRPHSYNSSNLFNGVSRKSGGLIINLQRFKNYYEKMSNVVGLAITKSVSHKENQQPEQNKQQDHAASNQNRNFKIRSLKVKNITTSVQPPISTKRIRTITVQLKQPKNSKQITRMTQKLELKQFNILNQTKKCNWGIIIDAELFLHPRSFWNRKSSSCGKRTISKNARIKTDILDSFLNHLLGLQSENGIQIVFRVSNTQQMQELQTYLKPNKQMPYSIFFFKKKPADSLSFYNLEELVKLPERILIIEQKHKHSLVLPFFSLKQQVPKKIAYLLVDCLIKYTDSHIIESFDIQNCRVNVNASFILQQNLEKYGINEKMRMLEASRSAKRQSRKSSRYRCNSEVLSYSQSVSIPINNSLEKMQDFKQKMVKYIRILIEQRKGKQILQSQSIYDNSNSVLLNLQSLDRCSKTPNQIIAQLTKLNNYNAKQIQNFQTHAKNMGTVMQFQAPSNFEYQIPIFRLT